MAEEQPVAQPPRSSILRNAALAGALITPLAMLLPPRRMDARFAVLAGTFSLCTNHLAYEYTGQSIYARFSQRMGSILDTGLPEGARRTQQLIKEKREREAAEKQQRSQAQEDKKAGLVKEIWMGGEGEDWSQKRAEEHRKSFQEGKGMSDIILEQVMDVFSGQWRARPKGGDGSRLTPEEESSSKK